MKIGTSMGVDWLDRPGDLRYLKQIGVDCIDIVMSSVPGYSDAGRLTREGLTKCVDAVSDAGLAIERINSTGDQTLDTFLGGDGSQRELDNLVHNAQLSGEFDLPVMGIQCFQASLLGQFSRPIHSYVEGRGGYQYAHMDLSGALDQPAPEGAPSAEQIWEGTLKIFNTVSPVAESTGIKLAMHGNDPPVPSLWGVPQVLINFDAFERLFAEASSPNVGMTFCVGTRYESGEDVFEGIRRFGGQGKIFHVHFRNVHGTIPGNDWYQEVIPDAGDLNMAHIARALHEVGYEGVIDYDHVLKLTPDDEHSRRYVTYCVGHMRGILQSLN